MSEPVVVCPDGEKRDSKRVISGIVNLFSDLLRQRGVGGEWELELFKKTGGGGQERLVFKRQTSDNGLIFHVRPLDRDSSWSIITYPPDDVTAKDVDRLISNDVPKKEEQPVVQKEIDVSEVLCNNRIYYATVTSHVQHGFEIEIETKSKDTPTVGGYIDLSDLDKYDPTSLNKYPVGRKFRIVVCDNSKRPVTCSTRIKDLLGTNSSRDEFTGIPDENGVLSLRTYSCSFRRILDILDEFANVVMMPAKRNFITHDQAVEVATQFLLRKYNARSINPTGLLRILSSFCGRMEATRYQIFQRKDDGYVLTPDAWEEIGGNTLFAENTKKEPPPEILWPDDPQPTIEIQPDPEPVTEADHDVAERMLQPDMDELEKAASYFGKLCRLSEISTQLESLIAEEDSIKKWLKEHRDLKVSAENMQALCNVNREHISELLVPKALDSSQGS